MRVLSKHIFNQIRESVYRNARYVEIVWWNYFFENGSKDDVVKALSYYQNSDGGFGNGLEPDCSNPNSSPATTYMAYTRLLSIGCDSKEHPMIQEIMRYIEKSEFFTERGWYWSIPSNNYYYCQPWYEFPNAPWFPEEWPPENYVNGNLISFILKYFEKNHPIYKKAIRVADYRISLIDTYVDFCAFTGEWNQESIEANDWISLFEALDENSIKSKEECEQLTTRFMEIVDTSAIDKVRLEVRRRIEKRGYSNEELDCIIDNLSHGNIWNKEELTDKEHERNKDFISQTEVWWKLIFAIEDLRILGNYGRLDENVQGKCNAFIAKKGRWERFV